jgi:hypothetical protein
MFDTSHQLIEHARGQHQADRRAGRGFCRIEQHFSVGARGEITGPSGVFDTRPLREPNPLSTRHLAVFDHRASIYRTPETRFALFSQSFRGLALSNRAWRLCFDLTNRPEIDLTVTRNKEARMSTHNERIGIRLLPDDRAVLERLAGRRSLSEAVRDLLAAADRRQEEDQIREAFRADLAKISATADRLHESVAAVQALLSGLAGALAGLAALAADGAKHARVAVSLTHALAVRQLQGMGIRDGYESDTKEAIKRAEEAIAQLRAREEELCRSDQRMKLRPGAGSGSTIGT